MHFLPLCKLGLAGKMFDEVSGTKIDLSGDASSVTVKQRYYTEEISFSDAYCTPLCLESLGQSTEPLVQGTHRKKKPQYALMKNIFRIRTRRESTQTATRLLHVITRRELNALSSPQSCTLPHHDMKIEWLR